MTATRRGFFAAIAAALSARWWVVSQICVDLSKILIPIFLMGGLFGFGQEGGNEASRSAIGQTASVASATRQDHADNTSAGKIDRTAASSRPSTPIVDSDDNEQSGRFASSGTGVVHNDGSFVGECLLTNSGDVLDYKCERLISSK
jgi:hypothetical protein